jgi:hypothetical protein
MSSVLPVKIAPCSVKFAGPCLVFACLCALPEPAHAWSSECGASCQGRVSGLGAARRNKARVPKAPIRAGAPKKVEARTTSTQRASGLSRSTGLGPRPNPTLAKTVKTLLEESGFEGQRINQALADLHVKILFDDTAEDHYDPVEGAFVLNPVDDKTGEPRTAAALAVSTSYLTQHLLDERLAAGGIVGTTPKETSAFLAYAAEARASHTASKIREILTAKGQPLTPRSVGKQIAQR